MQYFVLLLFFCTNFVWVHAIVGGNQAYASHFFMAAITINKDDGGRYFCGGTIISNDWIVTAGQCVHGATLFTITMGSDNLTELAPTAVRVATSDFVLHPNYSEITLQHDIGVIKFRQPIILNGRVQAVNVVAPLQVDDSRARALGWGQTGDDDTDFTEALSQIELVMISTEECRATYGNFIQDGMLCAVGNYNEGICYGDIGGPLVQPYSRYFRLVGIASFFSGNGCETPDPSGFTHVYKYREWITDETGV